MLTLFSIGMLLLLIAPITAQNTPEVVGLRPDAPLYARHGNHWVGFTQMQIDDGNGRVLYASIWYPALNLNSLEEDIAYPFLGSPLTVAGHALTDAELDFDAAPYPLVLLSHGANGFAYHLAHLGENLASHGFVVMAVEHQEGMMVGGFMYQSFISRMEDVSRQIDFAEDLTAEGDWAGFINVEQVGVSGMSFGGYTALAAGGGRIDWDGYMAWCDANPQLDPLGVCNDMTQNLDTILEMAGWETLPESPWDSFSDSRIDAIAALAPAGRFIGARGAESISIPTMIVAGTGDTIAIPEPNFYAVYDAMTAPKTKVMLEGANHTFMMFTCDDAPFFVAWELAFVCQDSIWDRERTQDLTNHFVTAFMLAELYGSEDAAYALRPDLVNFPGILYETTEF